MSEIARASLAACVMIAFWVMWIMVTDIPGANFGLLSHLLGLLGGPISGLTIYISTGR